MGADGNDANGVGTGAEGTDMHKVGMRRKVASGIDTSALDTGAGGKDTYRQDGPDSNDSDSGTMGMGTHSMSIPA